MAEIKNCPFCGEKASVWTTYYMGRTWGVICEGCGVRNMNYETEEEAIEAWNRRINE